MIYSLILASVIIVPVFAYQYFWQTEPQEIPSGIILTTPHADMSLGIYWNSACTDPVTTFDFGKMWHPDRNIRVRRRVYIKNEGNVTHTIYWNSTLDSITTEITNDFFANGTAISAGDKIDTYYNVYIDAYATVETYNWTITVWAEYTY